MSAYDSNWSACADSLCQFSHISTLLAKEKITMEDRSEILTSMSFLVGELAEKTRQVSALRENQREESVLQMYSETSQSHAATQTPQEALDQSTTEIARLEEENKNSRKIIEDLQFDQNKMEESRRLSELNQTEWCQDLHNMTNKFEKNPVACISFIKSELRARLQHLRGRTPN